MMNTQLQQLQAEGQLDTEAYRTCMLLTLTIKLVMAMVLGVLVACSFLVA
jgi:hypothetical protein